MNEPVKYKRLKEIAEELNARLDELHIGQLSREQLEQLADYSRELYERLVVLRFKAYDHDVKESEADAESPAQVSAVEPSALEPIPFKVREAAQVNLLDAIEEATQDQPATPIRPEVPAEKPREEVSVPAAQVTAAPSVNELIGAGIVRQALAENLDSTPIQDLKKAISHNQRFQFARELFKGNNQEYEVSVDKLNTTNREDALRHLNSLKSKYAWNEEDPVATDFIDLVERRHL